MLDDLGACQAALPLVLGQLVYLMQLPNNPLLLRRGKAAEVGVAAKHPFLFLDGKIAMLIEPVAKVTRRALNRRCIARIHGTAIAWTHVRRPRIRGAGRVGRWPARLS